jgi:hypothetical protein
VTYALSLPHSAVDGMPLLSEPQWMGVLYLSTKWGMSSLRELAISKLEKSQQAPLDRIDFAMKCNVDKWIAPAYITICTREQAISSGEAGRLGLDRYHQLVQIRERYHKCENPGQHGGKPRGKAIIAALLKSNLLPPGKSLLSRGVHLQ